MAYIYQIRNKINGKVYIGSTNNYKRRWSQHKGDLKRNKHCNKYLQNAWNKNKSESFVFEIIEEVNDEYQFQIEQHYLDSRHPFGDSGYNLSKIAVGDRTNKEDLEYIKKCKLTGEPIYDHKDRYLLDRYLNEHIEDMFDNGLDDDAWGELYGMDVMVSYGDIYLDDGMTEEQSFERWAECNLM